MRNRPKRNGLVLDGAYTVAETIGGEARSRVRRRRPAEQGCNAALFTINRTMVAM